MIITVYDAYTNEIEFEYTPEMKPETDAELDENGISHGDFTIYYLSGFEQEDGTEYTECWYTDKYYCKVTERG